MTIKIIHVGVGGRGRHWLDFVVQHPDFTAAACVDVDQKALESARHTPGQEHGKFFPSMEEALAQTQADAVLITSPSFLHMQHALQALDAGLAVMVEKPLACNLKEAVNVVDRARAVSRPVMVAENFRFFQAERTLRHILDEGMAGRITGAVCIDRRDQPSHTQGPWVKSMAEPFLTEISIHHFDSFRYLFNRQPVSIRAASYNPAGSDYEGSAAVNALIEFDGDLHVQYSGTMVANRYEYSLWVEGDKGDIWTDRRRVWWRAKGKRFFKPVKLVPVPKGDEERYPKAGTVSLLNQFRDAVSLGKTPETSGADNLWTLAMVEAGIVSVREGRKVLIDEVFTPGAPQNASPHAGKGSTSAANHKLAHTPPLSFPSTPWGRKEEGASKQRLLFIGLDAGDADLIEGWCQEGHLPNISQMRSQGAWARMQTTAEIVHVSAWPSIFTGASPDEHGLYHAYVMQPGQQNPVRPRPDKSPVPFLWKILSDQRKRCVIMDAFMTCPLQNFNGTQIVEWGTWSWFSEPSIIPESVKKEMQKKFGPYPAEDHSKVGMMPPADPQGFHQRLLAAVTKKTQVVKWLMEKEDWEFFLVVFGESHPAGHYFWHYHDESYIAHSKDKPGLSALRDVYVALDKAIGDILQSVDDATTVFLVSGDGMGPNYSGSHILNDLLTRMKLFNNIPSSVNGAAGKEAEKKPVAKADLVSTVRNMIPKSLRVAVSRALLPRSVNEKLSLRWKTAGISWQHTRAFLIENANEGYIRINLKGREPEGTVEPGKEYEELCEELYQTIKSATNPATGKRAANTVYKTDDIYTGPCRSHMPDIIINWNDDARLTTELLTEKYGLARSAQPGYALAPYYTGNHRPNAFTVAVGPEVTRGSILDGTSILDLAPTILTYFGITPPGYMTGKVLKEVSGETDHLPNLAPNCVGVLASKNSTRKVMKLRSSTYSNTALFIIGSCPLLFGLFADPINMLKAVGFPVGKLYGERGQTDLAILRILTFVISIWLIASQIVIWRDPHAVKKIREKTQNFVSATAKLPFFTTLLLGAVLLIKTVLQLLLYLVGYVAYAGDDFARSLKANDWLQHLNSSFDLAAWLNIGQPYLPFPDYVFGLALALHRDVYITAKIVNLFVSGIAVVVAYLLGSKLFGRAAGFFTAVLCAFQPWVIWLGISGMTSDIPSVVMIGFFALFLFQWLENNHSVSLLVAAFCLFAATGIRYENWFFSVTFSLFLVWRFVSAMWMGKLTGKLASCIGGAFVIANAFPVFHMATSYYLLGDLIPAMQQTDSFRVTSGLPIPKINMALLALSAFPLEIAVAVTGIVLLLRAERQRAARIYLLIVAITLLSFSVAFKGRLPLHGAGPERNLLTYIFLLLPFAGYFLVRLFRAPQLDNPAYAVLAASLLLTLGTFDIARAFNYPAKKYDQDAFAAGWTLRLLQGIENMSDNRKIIIESGEEWIPFPILALDKKPERFAVLDKGDVEGMQRRLSDTGLQEAIVWRDLQYDHPLVSGKSRKLSRNIQWTFMADGEVSHV